MYNVVGTYVVPGHFTPFSPSLPSFPPFFSATVSHRPSLPHLTLPTCTFDTHAQVHLLQSAPSPIPDTPPPHPAHFSPPGSSDLISYLSTTLLPTFLLPPTQLFTLSFRPRPSLRMGGGKALSFISGALLCLSSAAQGEEGFWADLNLHLQQGGSEKNMFFSHAEVITVYNITVPPHLKVFSLHIML